MYREELLKLIEALPPGCRIIGVGPDSGGYDCTTGKNIEVVTGDKNLGLAMLGVFGSDEARENYWKGVKANYTISPEEYHQIRKLLDSKLPTNRTVSATEVCRVLDQAALDGHYYSYESSMMSTGSDAVPPSPKLDKLYTKLTDPVAKLLKEQITWSEDELKLLKELQS